MLLPYKDKTRFAFQFILLISCSLVTFVWVPFGFRKMTPKDYELKKFTKEDREIERIIYIWNAILCNGFALPMTLPIALIMVLGS